MNNSSGFIFLLIFIIFICTYPVSAQSSFSDDLKISANANSGFLLPEYSFLSLVTNDYIRSGEICIVKETTGKSIWECTYNYPEYGLSLFYSSLGNDSIFGHETALTYFFKIYFSEGKRFRMYNRMGIGIGYVNRKFDMVDNYFNVAVGSNFNIHYNCRIGANYRVNEKIELNTGISFDHFSNGNTKDPNIGLNFVTAYGGLNYMIGKRTPKAKKVSEEFKRKNTHAVIIAFGGKHTRYLSSDYYYTTSVSFDFKREITRAFHIGIGPDLFYDSSVKSQFDSEGREYRGSYSFRSGIHLSQTVAYNRMSLTIQEGVYLLLKEKVSGYRMYNRGILQYQLNEKLFVRLAMKSYLYILDHPEIGVGYRF